MISGSAALTTSNNTTGSLSYINTIVSDAASSGSYYVTVPNRYMNENMASALRLTYGYNVYTKNTDMGSNNEYWISWGTIDPTPTPTVTPTTTPTVTPTVTPTHTVTPTVTPTNTVTVTPSITPTHTITPTPSITPTGTPAAVTPTPTPTSSASVQLYQSYNYSISATDLAAATGNTGGNAQYNNKVVVVLTNGYNCGNTTVRNFTYSFSAAGSSYISWLVSLKTNVPVLGYYKNDVLVTTGLISTQTANPSVPC